MLAVGLLPSVVPIEAMGQFVTGASSHPWEGFKLDAKTKVKVEFRNSNIDNIISFYERVSGVTIVKDPTLTGGLTVTSAKAVSLNDAFQILSTTLSLKNYDLLKDGNLLVIRVKKPAQPGGGFSFPGAGGGDSGFNPFGGSQSKLKVYPIKFANASQLARVLNDIYQATGTNPFAQFGGGGGRFGGGGGRFFGQGGGGGNPFANLTQGGSQQHNVRASSDDFSNSVIVNATTDDQVQVADLIRQLDHATDDAQITRVYKLNYAASDDLVAVVQNVLTANVPKGKGGASTGQTQGPGAFFNAIRGTTPGAGQVTSDPHTNSLIVTATPENTELVAKVIKDLDTEVKIQTSTFVFPLKNARADQVQQLLQSAFGTRQGVNNTNRTNTIQPNRPSTASSTSGNATGRSSTPGGQNLSGTIQANNIPIPLEDPNADSGELQTNITVAQGFGGFFGGGGQRPGGSSTSSTTKPQVGYDQNGKVVNVRDLTGQVTAISDPNTNSIIIVTTPENAELIRKVLDQLDRVPEQVMIETIITEATLDKANQFGVEFKLNTPNLFGLKGASGSGGPSFGIQNSTTPTTGLNYTVSSGNLSGFLNALKSETNFQVLSTPRIFTSNNVEADINISQSVPYITNTTTSAVGTLSYSYAFQDVGIVLTVNPHITSNGYVTMDITQTANDLQGYTSFNAPIVNKRQADTTVSVKDGETLILGGIIRSTVTASVDKVPVLGDIPLLGNLFKKTSHDKAKTELLIFLTPHIVRDPAEAKRLKDESVREMSDITKKYMKDNLPASKFPASSTGTSGDPKKPGGN